MPAHLCRHPSVNAQTAARVLQTDADDAELRVDSLATGEGAQLQRDRGPRGATLWRLDPRVAADLGAAVRHRTRADSARPRVEAHLAGYGWITNRTIRNMFALNVQQARQVLERLRATWVVVKDPSGPERGPSVKWLAASRGPRRS